MRGSWLRGAEVYDVIVVGARCAGSPLAMLLARRGYEVLLVDRVDPAAVEGISTLYIHRPGMACLERWGLADVLVASGCPPITRGRYEIEGKVISGALPSFDGAVATYAPRRRVLDPLLLGAAAEAGAEVRLGFSVSDVVWENGRVAGVRGRGPGGAEVVEKAAIVVGADGPRSRIARAVGCATELEKPEHQILYYSFWSGTALDPESVYLWGEPGQGGAALTTNDGLVLVAAGWHRRRQLEGSAEDGYERVIAGLPYLSDALAGAERVERLYGMRSLPNMIRRSHGPGWALVGDAGYVKDPVTAQGITDAFTGAEQLAQAIDAGLSGAAPLDGSLAGYQRARDVASAPFFRYTCQVAALKPLPPGARRMFKTIAADPALAAAFFGLNAKITDPDEFFSPRNVLRMMAGRAPKQRLVSA